MNASPRRQGRAVVTGAVVAVGFLATVGLHWPGELSPDSVLQLLEGRTGRYNTWHPPVMAWLLGLGDSIVPGAGLFILFDAALGFGALLSLLWLRPARAGWLSAATALVLCLLAQLALYQGIVWKDVLFTDAAVAGFVCLAHAGRHWPAIGRRLVLIGAASVLLVLAALTRQNGAILLPVAALALGLLGWRETRACRRSILLAVGWLALVALAILLANAALDRRSNGDSGAAEQIALLQTYDLAGAVAREPDLPLSVLHRVAPALEHAIRTDGAWRYRPERNDPLAESGPLTAALQEADLSALDAQWRDLIAAHLPLYLKLRSDAFAWVFLTPDIVACRPLFAGVEGSPATLRALGLAAHRNAKDYALTNYAARFMGTPIFSHAFWAAAALACLILLLRRRRPADIALACGLAGVFAFAASFFVISLACDYRYLYALDLSALAAMFYLSLDPPNAFGGTQ